MTTEEMVRRAAQRRGKGRVENAPELTPTDEAVLNKVWSGLHSGQKPGSESVRDSRAETRTLLTREPAAARPPKDAEPEDGTADQGR